LQVPALVNSAKGFDLVAPHDSWILASDFAADVFFAVAATGTGLSLAAFGIAPVLLTEAYAFVDYRVA